MSQFNTTLAWVFAGLGIFVILFVVIPLIREHKRRRPHSSPPPPHKRG